MAQIALPPKLIPVFEGRADVRGAHGGRGSGKTRSFAKMAAVEGYRHGMAGQSGIIVCAREFMNSLEDSSLEEVKRAIEEEDFLRSYYIIGDKFIKSKDGRINFAFCGLGRSIQSLKSKGRLLLCWVDEAEPVTESAWSILIPTLREEGTDWNAELWVTWNPKRKNAAVERRFRGTNDPLYKVVELNYTDNDCFPEKLERERLRDLERNKDMYAHVWLGEYESRADRLVFKNWKIEEFEAPADAHFRLGADWGFSVDPTVLIRCYIVGRKLFIDYEAYRVGCEIVNTPELFLTVPESEKWPIVADSARPETISHLQQHGFPRIMPAIKGARSVEEGIEWLQSFDIVVHPRCVNTINELASYSYKIDKDTEEVLPILEDKDNHVIDALRYACESARRVKNNHKELKYRYAGI